jgi:hypothetical protein
VRKAAESRNEDKSVCRRCSKHLCNACCSPVLRQLSTRARAASVSACRSA